MISVYGQDKVIRYVFSAPEGVLPTLEEGEGYVAGVGEPGVDIVVDGVITPGTQKTEILAFTVRATRDRLLSLCDWTQLPDVPQATRTVWTAYRQELRDITLQTDPTNIIWPIKPS